MSVYEAQEERRRSDAETARTYKLDKQEELREEGRTEGRVEGEQIGRQKGRKEGLQIAMEVLDLARNGLSADAIAHKLQIDVAEINELLTGSR